MGQELELLQQLVLGMERMNGDFQEVKADIQEMKGDIQGLKTEMKEVKVDIQGLKTEMKEVKADIQEMKGDIQGLKTEMKEVKTEVQALKEQQVRLEVMVEQEVIPNVRLIAENWLPLTEKVNQIEDQAEEIGLIQDIIIPVVRKHSYDLDKLKRAQ